MNSDCIFCKIANKTIESKIIFEDDQVIAFPDINPQAPTHILVIPKNHLEKLTQIPELSSALFSAINKIVAQLDSYRIVFNYGAQAGQAVAHLHFHILSGRKMNWPPG